MFKNWYRRAALAIALNSVGCGGTKDLIDLPPPPPPPAVVPASVTIAGRSDTLPQLVPVTLSATVRGTNGQVLTTSVVRWASLNDRMATIDSGGVLTPRKPGIVSIVATVGSLADTTRVIVGMRWLSIGASKYFGTCGIGGDSTAYCWGEDFFNRRLVQPPPSRPTEIPGGRRFASVVTGGDFACATTGDRSVYCWGKNDFGQFGSFFPDTSMTPARVPLAVGITQLTAGNFHLCGLSVDGDVYCWGDNEYGQLADGGPSKTGVAYDPVPRKIAGLPRIKSITAGWWHECALSEAGQAYCWGDNDAGHAGGGVVSPVAVVTAVLGNLVFRDVGSKFDGSCGIAVAGGAYCWGNNGLSPITNAAAVPNLETGTSGYTEIAGSPWVLCGLTPTGMMCRGNNFYATLGAGSSVAGAATPVPVTGGADFVKMTVGYEGSCAITRAGKAFCWGFNGEGQVGDGSQLMYVFVPTAVADPVTP